MNDRKTPTMTKIIENINSVKAMYRTWCLEDGIDVRSTELEAVMTELTGESRPAVWGSKTPMLVFIPPAPRCTARLGVPGRYKITVMRSGEEVELESLALARC